MKNILFIVLCFVGLSLMAQREDHTWYFSGTSKGLFFDFNTNAVSITSDHSPLSYEGCGVSADPITGNVLFYSNGIKVIDKSHTQMPNGGGLLGNITCATNGIPCPVPSQPTKYYLFYNSANSPNAGAIYYSIIDMNLAGNGSVSFPTGDIVSTQKNISAVTNAAEGFAVIAGSNSDYWIVSPQNNSNIIRVYRITYSGIVLNNSFTVSATIGDARTVRFCTVNNKISIANMTESQGCFIMDFNIYNGNISNFFSVPGSILGTATNIFTGFDDTEWSPDGTKMYLSKYRMAAGSGRIYQYDLNFPSNAISLIYTLGGGYNNNAMGFQLAPDGKIYFLYLNNTYTDSRLIGAISSPNIAGIGCNFVSNVLDMGTSFPTTVSFPQFGLPFKYTPSNVSLFKENLINIFPNPVSENLVIDGYFGCEIKVFDAKGNLIINTVNNGKINVSSLKSGVYFINISENQKEYYSKFIIER